MLPIFRTGLIQFCHPRPCWNCILPFFYKSKFLELFYYTYHSYLSFHCFPANTFTNVLLHFLFPTFFPAKSIEVYCYTFLLLPIFRTGLIHFCHHHPFWNCILPFFYTSPFWGLYYYTYHYIFIFHCFPADTFRIVLLHFLLPVFLDQFHRSVLIHFSTAAYF
jgi:hypothetical protein